MIKVDQIQSILLEKIKDFTDSQSSEIKIKEKECQNLLAKIIDMRRDSIEEQQNLLKIEMTFIEKDEITKKLTNELDELNEKLQTEFSKNFRLIKKSKEENDKNSLTKSSLLKDLNLESKEREKFEKAFKKLKEDFNKFIMMSSTSEQKLSEDEIAFREKILQHIDPDFINLDFNNENLEDVHV